MSCCCQTKRKFETGCCGWAPNMVDYPLSVVQVVAGYNSYQRAQVNRVAAKRAAYAREDEDRLSAYFNRRGPLFGRINAGGFDQPDQANWDGDQ